MRLKVTRSRHRMSKHHQTEARYKYRLDRRWPFPGRPCSQDSAAQLSPSRPWYHPLVCLQEWRQILANMPPFASPEQVSVELTCSTFSEFGLNPWQQWRPFSVMPWPPLRTILYELWRKILKMLLCELFPLSEWFKRFGRTDLLATTVLPSEPAAVRRRPLAVTAAWQSASSVCSIWSSCQPYCAFWEEQDWIQASTSRRQLTKRRLYFLTVLDKLLYSPPQIRHQESRIDGFCRDELFLTSVSELTGAEPQAIFRTHNWKLILSNKWIPGAAWLKPFLKQRLIAHLFSVL